MGCAAPSQLPDLSSLCTSGRSACSTAGNGAQLYAAGRMLPPTETGTVWRGAHGCQILGEAHAPADLRLCETQGELPAITTSQHPHSGCLAVATVPQSPSFGELGCAAGNLHAWIVLRSRLPPLGLTTLRGSHAVGMIAAHGCQLSAVLTIPRVNSNMGRALAAAKLSGGVAAVGSG
jgi:hypothetical protein